MSMHETLKAITMQVTYQKYDTLLLMFHTCILGSEEGVVTACECFQHVVNT